VRIKGSDGGQKGLRSIQEAIGTAEYARLRIGVGSPGEHWDAADYVLSRFKPAERAAVDDAIAQAAQAVLVWVRQGPEACMNRFNGPPAPEKPKKEKPAKDKADKRAPADPTKQTNSDT
jgi:PTH1 family peptidyl-tRNA hydrolase